MQIDLLLESFDFPFLCLETFRTQLLFHQPKQQVVMAHSISYGQYQVTVLHSVGTRAGSRCQWKLGPQQILPYIFRYRKYHVRWTGRARNEIKWHMQI